MGKRVFRSLALTALLGTAMGLTAPAPAEATLFYADTVLFYFPSGAPPIAVPAQPYGGTYPGGIGFPVRVPLCVVLGDEPGCFASGGNVDFLSLPIGAGIAVGFTDESIYDGPGSDFRVVETVNGPGETANVFFSTDGTIFTFIGVADGTTDFDLASFGLGGTAVVAIEVIGSGNGGASPGYDLEHIRALNVPEPGSLSLIGLGLAGLVARRRRQRS